MSPFGDAYIRTARVTPAVLVVLPTLAFLWYLPAVPALGGVLPVLSALGVIPVAVEVVRARGKQVEQRLTTEWDGLPTTRALRFRNNDRSDLRAARRTVVEQLTSTRLPTAREETANPQAADARYVAAVKAVIARLRGTQQGVVLQAENVTFGFRRNLRGLRPIGVTVVLAAIVVNIAMFWIFGALIAAGLVAIAHVLVAVFWIALVRDIWVRKQADTYSDQLFASATALAAETRPRR